MLMKKLLFILTVFLAAAACEESKDGCTFPIVTPSGFEIEAGEGGVYTFTTNVPVYLSGCRVVKSDNEILFDEYWKKPMKLPKTFEKTWFTLTQRDDTTFEITIDENHDSGLYLDFGLWPYDFPEHEPTGILVRLR